jgi:very-short-patch-repair endonuclease
MTHARNRLARELRRGSTEAERCLWLHLRAGRLEGAKFRRQHPIGRYVVDFVCLRSRLVIEVDGSQHIESAGADAERTRALEEQGYRVLRFWNNDVLLQTEGVLQRIVEALTPGPSPASGRGGEGGE